MQVFTSDEFIGVKDIALTHVCLLEIGAAETSYEVCPLEPGNNVGANEEKYEWQEAREKEGSEGRHGRRRGEEWIGLAALGSAKRKRRWSGPLRYGWSWES